MNQERKQIPLRAKVAAIVALGGAAALAACGGKGEKADNPAETPTTGPSPTRTVEPTPTPTAIPTIEPTPEPTRFVPKKLSEAEYIHTDYETVLDSLIGNSATDTKGVFELHPDANNVVDDGGNQLTQGRLENNLSRCQSGGDDPRTIELDRTHGCSSLTYRALVIYQKTGYEEFYQLAVNSANYLLTELPQRQAEFDALLEPFAHDASPTLEK